MPFELWKLSFTTARYLHVHVKKEVGEMSNFMMIEEYLIYNYVGWSLDVMYTSITFNSPNITFNCFEAELLKMKLAI